MSEIVVGIDDSAGARDALAFAERLAKCAGASVRLATAFNYSDIPSRASNATFRDVLRRTRQTLLRSAAASIDGVSGTDAIADPSPPHALHSAGRAVDAAMVVVGSTHRGAVGRVVPGSTGERLLHGSPCPSRSCPAATRTTPVRSGRIGVGYDGSEESRGRARRGVRACAPLPGDAAGHPRLRRDPHVDARAGDHARVGRACTTTPRRCQRKSFDPASSGLPADLRLESRLQHRRRRRRAGRRSPSAST